MTEDISPRQRKELSTKMTKVFEENINVLSKEMQEILMDDLVTAFFSRLAVLTRVKSGKPKRDLEIQCSNDTLELTHAHTVQH